nr:GNAT family N-acetyltransferase [Stutzerimonas stutzeri]
MISVRSITAGDWCDYRNIRLRALRDSPDAFGSTYEAEAVRNDDAWESRIADAIASGTSRILVALNQQELCGLVWCKLSASDPEAADIFQMWVAPTSRGSGAGRALLEEALTWARGTGARRVRLDVAASNSRAMRLYKSCGFRPAGPLEPLRDGSDLVVQPMELVF